MAKSPKARHDYARELAAGYAGFPEVQAVVLGGSLAAQAGDSRSDVDLYVYHTDEIRIDRRTGLARTYCRKPEINNQFWETGDEWIDEKNGIHVDVMYRSTTWIAAELRHILIEHRAATGYSTCLWFNVLHSEILFDRAGWFADLQKQASVPYPEALQRAIIQKNWPILRHNLSSYRYQLQSAIRRKDDVSINHRLAAMLQSYFDILFALNSQPHPGEKRIQQWAEQLCPDRPENLTLRIQELLEVATQKPQDLITKIDVLVDNLEQSLMRAGIT